MLDEAVRLQQEGRFSDASALYRHCFEAYPDLRPRGADFLIIGAGKSGTGWMRKCLSRHEGVRILSGEHNYFSRHTDLSPVDYSALFKPENFKGGHKATDGYIQGEKSPSYQIMSSARIELCAALYPKAKIILLVRGPVDRAWSNLKMVGFPEGGEAYERIVRIGHYERDVRRWLEHFADIHIVDFDEICTAPDRVMDAVHAFLGVEPLAYRNVQEFTVLAEPKRADMPDEMRRVLEDIYRGERWDVPWLRSIVADAAKARAKPARTPAEAATVAS